MSYYRKCPFCGANLDPGELCDCQQERAEVLAEVERIEREKSRLIEAEEDGQLRMAV